MHEGSQAWATTAIETIRGTIVGAFSNTRARLERNFGAVVSIQILSKMPRILCTILSGELLSVLLEEDLKTDGEVTEGQMSL